MNWSKAKTILIIFFICTNLFLLTTILMSVSKTSIVTDDIIDSTIMILKNNRIEIDPEIIPRRTQPAAMIRAENFITSYEEFAKKFVGEDLNMLETNVYEGSRGKIFFSGDRFSFDASKEEFSELTEKLNESNARQVVLDVLKAYGFEDSTLLTDVSGDESEYVVTVTKQKNEMPLFSSKLKVVMNKKGVKRVSGSWFFEKGALKNKYTLKSVSGVLIDYISVANRPTTEEKITSVTLGYYIPDEGILHKDALLVPCWKIALDDGGEYILNALENNVDY